MADEAMESATASLHSNGSTHNLAGGIVYSGDGVVNDSDLVAANGVNGSTANGIDATGHPSPGPGGPPTGLPWPGESDASREEVVRLMIAGLREIGYGRAAATLEMESGYSLDPFPEVAAFRDAVLAGRWSEVEHLLKRDQALLTGKAAGEGVHGPSAASGGRIGRLGISNIDGLREARFLVVEQKYLELLEAGHTKRALSVLRTEVAPVAQEIAAAASTNSQPSPVSLRNLSLRSPDLNAARIDRQGARRRRANNRLEEVLPQVSSSKHAGVGSGSMMLDSGAELDPSRIRADIDDPWGGDDDLDIDYDDVEDAGPAVAEARGEMEPAALGRLSELSSYLMCGNPEEVRQRSGWAGVSGGTRARVLDAMQAFVPPSHLFPHNRLPRLLEQAKLLQKAACTYHVTDVPISLLTDHTCPRASFPRLSTHILRQHTDEVWRVEWCPNGRFLATAGADRKCIVWRLVDRVTNGPIKDPGDGPLDVSFVSEHVLAGHPAGVAAVAWSPDGATLVTASDCTIKIWNVRWGSCSYSVTKHDYEVSAVAWLPDGQSFVSGAMDQTIQAWSVKGQSLWSWNAGSTRILDIAIAPNGRYLVAVGIANEPANAGEQASGEDEGTPVVAGPVVPSLTATGEGLPVEGDGVRDRTRRMVVYDLVDSKPIGVYNHAREITCVSVSADSRFALINTSPDEVQLVSIEEGRIVQQYVGQKQGKYVIKSCFGGAGGNFVLSGSEDGMIYAWHRETAQQIEVLSGHKPGTVVNAVAWNPKYPGMFASAGDDHTVRIWQAPAAASLPSSLSDVL